LAIAGVLAMGPEVLVLDEPGAALDPGTREDLLGVVRSLREAGTSVVMVSHDLDEIAEVASRVCVLEGGEVRDVGTPVEVFYARPDTAPATVRVTSLLRDSHPEVGRPVRFDETLAALKGLLRA
jgi:energy-coupling factor transport system ATP-binding protein